MRRLVFLVFIFLIHPTTLWAADTMGLQECYEAALKYSTDVAISEQEINRARARYLQALGTTVPQIYANGSEFIQQQLGASGTGISGSFARQFQPEVALSLNMPLFQGFKEVSAIKGSHYDKAMQEYNLEEAKRLLFLDVSQVFYTILLLDQSINRTQQMIGVYSSRLGELNRRVGLGKSRESEIATQETDLSLLRAELENFRGQSAVAYETMSFLTGLSPQPRVAEKRWDKRFPQSLTAYLDHATLRPDVQASQMETQVARQRRNVARSELAPHLNFNTNYYPYRTGFLEDVKWDMTFNLSVPLLNLENVGFVKEANAELRQSELRAEAQKRLSERQIRETYQRYQSTRQELYKYETAVSKAKQSYDLLIADYESGLVTNLDVLQAQQIWLDAMRSRDRTRMGERLQWVSLQAQAGVLP